MQALSQLLYPHLLTRATTCLNLKTMVGLMIPSEGTVKVVRAAERVIRQNSKEQGASVSFVNRFVRAEIGSEDVFLFWEHIAETQFGIENHVICGVCISQSKAAPHRKINYPGVTECQHTQVPVQNSF